MYSNIIVPCIVLWLLLSESSGIQNVLGIVRYHASGVAVV